MAIDTRDKRLSVLGYGIGGLGSPLPTPDATVAAAERRSLGELYSGVNIAVNWTVRASMVGYTSPFLRPLGPYPDGTLNNLDRQMVRGLYHSIAAASPGGTLLVFSHTIGRAFVRSLGRFS